MKQNHPVQVVITVDTEPDDAWTDHMNPSVANVQALLRLQELLDRFGARATCLVTYRVIQDDAAVAVLRELVEKGGAEVGAHLHPWETPPFMDHGLGLRVFGNSMRLESQQEVRLDDRWKTELNRDDLSTFERVAGTINRKLGYE